mgnify:CR=1 FL=1
MGFDALVGADLVNSETIAEVKEQLGNSLEEVAQQEPEEQQVEEVKVSDEVVEEVEEVLEEKPKKNRLDERMQQIVNRTNEVEAIAKAAEYRWQRQRELERMEFENKFQQQELEYAKRFDELKTALLSQKGPQEPDDPLTSFRRETLKEAETIADKKVQRALQEVENLKKVYQEQQEEQERARRHITFDNMTNQALNTMLGNFEEKDRNNLRSSLFDLIMTYSASTGKYPEQALPEFQNLLDQYAEARSKVKMKSKGEAVKKSLAAPKVAGNRSTAASVSPSGIPTKKEIDDAGGSLFRAFLNKANKIASTKQ